MKKLFYSICVGSLALAVSAQAVDQNDANVRRKGKAVSQSSAKVATPKVQRSAQVRTHQNMNTQRFQQRNTASARVNSNTNLHRNRVGVASTSNVSTAKSLRADRVRNNDVTVRHSNHVRNTSDLTVNRGRNINRNLTVNRDRNVTVNRNINRNRNVVVTNNWRGDRFSGSNYTAFRNYHRQWHDRGWWHSHYSRITFVFGAPYYWNAGYWYPAWGYNAGYVYPYDGPIYGYNGLSPDQVVVNVQAQLQQDGYYSGPVDGVLGPMTRQAIADFQADHGLAITSAVDQPTLATLGLV